MNPVYNATSNINVTGTSITGNGGVGACVVGTPTNGFVLNASGNWWGIATEGGIAAKMCATWTTRRG